MESLPDEWIKDLPSGFIEGTYENCTLSQLKDGLSRVKREISDKRDEMMERRKAYAMEKMELSLATNTILKRCDLVKQESCDLEAMIEMEGEMLESLKKRVEFEDNAKNAITSKLIDEKVKTFQRRRASTHIQRKWRAQREK